MKDAIMSLFYADFIALVMMGGSLIVCIAYLFVAGGEEYAVDYTRHFTLMAIALTIGVLCV